MLYTLITVGEFFSAMGHLENVIFTLPLLLVALIAALQIVGLGLEEMLGAMGFDFGHDVDVDLGHGVDLGHDVDFDIGHDVAVDVDVDMDVDVDVDADVDLDVDADAGVDAGDVQIEHGILLSSLGFFHLGKVPLGFIVEMLLAFFGLAGLGLNMVLLPTMWPEFPQWSVTAQLGVAWPAAALVSLTMTKVFAGIIARVAPGGGARPTRFRALAGRRGTVVSATADASQGRAEVKDRKGEAHTVFVRLVDGEAPLAKGDTVQLVAYEPSENYFRAQGVPAGVK